MRGAGLGQKQRRRFRARRCAIRAWLLLAAAGSVVGCSYFAEAPEITPNHYAPAAADRPWSPAPKYAGDYVVPQAERAPQQVPSAPPEPSHGQIGLSRLITVALTNNPDTRVAWQRARVAAAAYGSSRAAYYPTVSSETDAGYTRQIIELPGSTIAPFKQWYAEPALRLTYILLDFGRRDADDETARNQLAASNFAFNRELQTVVFNTQRAFYALAASHAGVTAAQQNLELAKTDNDAVQRRVDLGLATLPELLLARERVAQSEYDLASARLVVRESEASMALAIGVAANTPLEVESLASQSIPKSLGHEVDELIRDAVRQRPDLAAQVATLNASEASVRRARAEFYPMVDVLGEYGEQVWNYQFLGPTATVSQPRYRAQMMLDWDIFTGFKRLNDLKQAEASRAEAAATVESSELGAIAEVWRSYYEFESTQKKYEYAEALLAATNEAYSANLDTYRQGLSTIVELLTADRDLANARFTMIQSTADLLSSSAAVAYAVGAIEMPHR